MIDQEREEFKKRLFHYLENYKIGFEWIDVTADLIEALCEKEFIRNQAIEKKLK